MEATTHKGFEVAGASLVCQLCTTNIEAAISLRASQYVIPVLLVGSNPASPTDVDRYARKRLNCQPSEVKPSGSWLRGKNNTFVE